MAVTNNKYLQAFVQEFSYHKSTERGKDDWWGLYYPEFKIIGNFASYTPVASQIFGIFKINDMRYHEMGTKYQVAKTCARLARGILAIAAGPLLIPLDLIGTVIKFSSKGRYIKGSPTWYSD